MFEPLFPNWSSPAAVAGFVALIALSNVTLVALVATAPGSGRRLTAVAAAVAVGSVAAAVSVLRLGGLGNAGGNVELLARFMLILVAGRAVVSRPTAVRIAAGAIAVGGALVLLVVTVPLYGEATVAP
ncbi:hypothetical protein GRX01_14755 [Halobaculum sp. WSA2]|uniref:Uncharacterized protein n=1 Tax=Halobaculum saliterrae TaxID=2073113 RepID=A0A6B0T1T5_9EURY|nr:hypothetical protein [Halobaculum saliterrae]MXR42592.1 hypothetical protein [Halobaculum saliterrae]